MVSERIKHGRIPHLPWSKGTTSDDKMLHNTDGFHLRKVVVTVKLDGENITLYPDYLHARSINETHHPSRAWIKNLHSRMGYNIPTGWRICGEYLYAQHTIPYKNLDTYFYVHSIWDEHNICLSWSDTMIWGQLLDLILVPVLYIGGWDEKKIRNICPDKFNDDDCEGIVVRFCESYKYDDMPHCIAKFVKEDFKDKLAQGSSHWMHRMIVPNGLKHDKSNS